MPGLTIVITITIPVTIPMPIPVPINIVLMWSGHTVPICPNLTIGDPCQLASGQGPIPRAPEVGDVLHITIIVKDKAFSPFSKPNLP